MDKYRVLSLLWDGVQNRYIYPGEIIALDAGVADKLTRRGRVAPVEEEIEIEPAIRPDDPAEIEEQTDDSDS